MRGTLVFEDRTSRGLRERGRDERREEDGPQPVVGHVEHRESAELLQERRTGPPAQHRLSISMSSRIFSS